MTRLLHMFYAPPWIQPKWTKTGGRLIDIHLANLNWTQKIEPMEKV